MSHCPTLWKKEGLLLGTVRTMGGGELRVSGSREAGKFDPQLVTPQSVSKVLIVSVGQLIGDQPSK